MIKLFKLTLIFLFFGVILCNADSKATYDDSSNWPFRLSYLGGYNEGSNIPDKIKLPGVLIRIEKEKNQSIALIDFGGEGIYKIPVEFTDLAERAAAIKEGRATKAWPNHTFLLANKCILSAGGSIGLLKADTMSQYQGIIYLPINEEDLTGLDEVLESVPANLREGKLWVILPDFNYQDQKLIDSLSKEIASYDFAMPRSFLSKALIWSLHYDHSKSFILTDLDGKILNQRD
ncbi:MAG: Uncharacterised protein [Opitutia bacterium UBA7350]|nr:MAG: Uncharacterised protein [Opitutae bacterium UBA7350]